MTQAVSQGASVVGLAGTDPDFDRLLEDARFDFNIIPISRRSLSPWGDIRLLLVLWWRFRSLRPGIVHSFTVKPVLYGTLAAAMARVPCRVVTITGVGHAFTTAGLLVRSIVIFLYRVSLKYAHVVFFQNADDQRMFIQKGLVRPEVTRVIAGSGVDLRRYRPVPLPLVKGVPGPCFLMIARFLKEKGIVEYLQAAKIVKRRHAAATFRLIGSADERNPSSLTLSQVEALAAECGVELSGEIEDVRPALSMADVVVLPSYREGVPRVLLEAGAMGRALIATDAIGCKEVVKDCSNGYSVPVGDVEALAEAMVKLCVSPVTIKLFGKRSRSFVEQHFDETSVINETLKAYSEVICK